MYNFYAIQVLSQNGPDFELRSTSLTDLELLSIPSFSLAIIDPNSASISSKDSAFISSKVRNVLTELLSVKAQFVATPSLLSKGGSIPVGTSSMLFLLCELVGVVVLDMGELFWEHPFVGTMIMFFLPPPCQLDGAAVAWGGLFGVDGRSWLLHRLLLIRVLNDFDNSELFIEEEAASSTASENK